MASTGTSKSRLFTPLSPHGMPKAPSRSNEPHRFSSFPPPTVSVIPSSPRMPSLPPLMSPPMSARSFDTFIDSAPSTPAYSPYSPHTRMGWDDSSIVLLSPVSTAPSSPPPEEPQWEMMTAIRKPSKPSFRHNKPMIIPPLSLSKGLSSGTSLSSHPVTPVPYNKENQPPKANEGPPDRDLDDQANDSDRSLPVAPLEKLASKMKSILKRKTSASEKKSQRRRRQYQELEHMETVHWTEM